MFFFFLCRKMFYVSTENIVYHYDNADTEVAMKFLSNDADAFGGATEFPSLISGTEHFSENSQTALIFEEQVQMLSPVLPMGLQTPRSRDVFFNWKETL